MASHFWKIPPRTLEDSLVMLTGYFAVGAAGALTTVFPSKTLKGVLSIARTAAGTYTITLDDKYADLLYIDANAMNATAQDLTFNVSSYALTSNTTANPPVINVRFLTGGTPADPASGTVVFLDIRLKNSTTN